MLTHLLADNQYALCLTPGFFRFYAEIGILEALHEANCLNPSHVTGSSAGALVGAFVAAGSNPQTMIQQVLAIQRTDVWDVGGIGGLLKGELFHKLIEDFLPVKNFEDCTVPCVFTAFDLGRMKTNFISTGSLAVAVRASCCFPGLFQPVMIDGRPHIDGGVWDHVGLLALEHCFNLDLEKQRKLSNESNDSIGEEEFTNKLVVNVVFSTPSGSVLPKNLQKCRLLTIVVENIPMVTPFTMSTAGPIAYKLSRAAMRQALHSAHIQEYSPNHWVCFVDGALVKSDELDRPSPFPIQIPIERQISIASDMTDSNILLPSETMIPHNTSVQTLPIDDNVTTEGNSGETSGNLQSENNSSTHATSPSELPNDMRDTMTENEHSSLSIPVAGDQHHIARVDHNRVHITTTSTAPDPEHEENILETMIEELYQQDDISIVSLTPEEEEKMEVTTNPNEVIVLPTQQVEKQAPAEVLNHVPFTISSSQLNDNANLSSELKLETRDQRSSSFTANNLPDFIRIPSFSFINGTYYLYQKVSTTINSGMNSASQTSNQLINAVTSTFSTSFTATSPSNEDPAGEGGNFTLLSSQTTKEEAVIGEKRGRQEDQDSYDKEEEEIAESSAGKEADKEENGKETRSEGAKQKNSQKKRRKTKAN